MKWPDRVLVREEGSCTELRIWETVRRLRRFSSTLKDTKALTAHAFFWIIHHVFSENNTTYIHKYWRKYQYQ